MIHPQPARHPAPRQVKLAIGLLAAVREAYRAHAKMCLQCYREPLRPGTWCDDGYRMRIRITKLERILSDAEDNPQMVQGTLW